MYLFLINGSIVVFLNTKDSRVILLMVLQIVVFAGSTAFLKYYSNYFNGYLISNIYLLLSFSFIMLERLSMDKAIRQFIFAVVSLVVGSVVLILITKYKDFKYFYKWYFLAGIVLILAVLIFGAKEYGAKLSINIFNISIQTSEFVKISFVFFLASIIFVLRDVRGFIFSTIGTMIHVGILILCKDLGAALIFLLTYMFVVFVAYRKYVLFFGEIVLGILGGILLYNLFPHVQTRFLAWSDPLSVVDNEGYQICQSLFAIGTGDWLGLGLFQGQPNKIPVVSKDFIFSAISEELGCITALSLIVIILCTVIYIFIVAMDSSDSFYGLVSVGFGVIIATQAILNIGGVTKFIPSTGVTLPLISYGGSSLLSLLIMFFVIYHTSNLSVDIIQEKQDRYMRRTGNYDLPEIKYGLHRNEIVVVIICFILIFSFMGEQFISFLINDREEYIYNSFNPRYATYAENIMRGDIVTSDGKVIAYTDNSDGKEVRVYPCKELFSHAVGYVGEGMAGLEAQFSFDLNSAHSSVSKNLMSKKSKKKVKGDMLVTTLDYDTQLAAYQAMGTYDGAIVALEPSTGKILAMVSKPDFDPNYIADYWEIVTDENNDTAILLNRSTQGMYPPGSIFKLVTTVSYLRENNNSYSDFDYDCNGVLSVEDFDIHCSSNKKHGNEGLPEAFANSCNCAYAKLGIELKDDSLKNAAEDLYFNKKLPTDIDGVKKSIFDLEAGESKKLVGQTSMGQGNTQVTPLHMCMLTSAVANDGILAQPYMFDSIQSTDGYLIKKHSKLDEIQVLSKKEANILQNFMSKVITEGTCDDVNFGNYDVYGKTGTAEFSKNKKEAHSWFIGYATNDAGKTIAVAVIMEKAGYGSKYAAPAAAKVFDAYLSK